jgi:hypothetical protein
MKGVRATFLAITVGLAGCSFRIQEQPSSVAVSDFHYWPKPVNGEFLCLSAIPGTPVYAYPGSNQVIGFTRNVVAFGGESQGGQVMIVYYTGINGWVDSAKLSPFHGSRPGQACIIPGRTLQQQPIFQIN